MKITSAPMSIATDPAVRRCSHGIAIGFVLNIDRMPMARPFCDRDDCAAEARKYGHGNKQAEAVLFGAHNVPPALVGRS